MTPPVFVQLKKVGESPNISWELPSKEERDYLYFTKISYGQTVGYRLTDLIYAGDLIANVGDSITSILDKIKNMLSEFEYFYNLDGQFIF